MIEGEDDLAELLEEAGESSGDDNASSLWKWLRL